MAYYEPYSGGHQAGARQRSGTSQHRERRESVNRKKKRAERREKWRSAQYSRAFSRMLITARVVLRVRTHDMFRVVYTCGAHVILDSVFGGRQRFFGSGIGIDRLLWLFFGSLPFRLVLSALWFILRIKWRPRYSRVFSYWWAWWASTRSLSAN